MKKGKLYWITSLIVLGLFTVLFIEKGIYPFGSHSLIWGDMHDQITAFYYHFYDVFHGNASFLIEWNAGGGVNFFGILAYYIMSPINFFLLLFPREKIYLAVSLVIAFKVLLSSVTALYFIRTYFKKLPSALSIFLALSYAFSGYVLSFYQITAWMDAVYLFPLVMVGLKKVLDLEKPYLYILFLTLSLICSFYVSFMTILFIFFASYLYLLVYQTKEKRGKAMLSLGIATLFSLLLSLFVVIPSFDQIANSSRLTTNFKSLLNSRDGPLVDKLSLVILGGIFYFGLLLLIKRGKQEKKFCLWYFSTCLITGIPLIVEPINKVWHFGSYAFFPYRFGFITIFLLMVGAGYGFLKDKEKPETKKKKHPIGAYFVSIVTVLLLVLLVNRKYDLFQETYYKLTLSESPQTFLVLAATTLLACLGYFFVYRMTDGWKKTRILTMGVITIAQIFMTSSLYFGMDFAQEELTSQYESVTQLAKTYKKEEVFRVKNDMPFYMMNTGSIMHYANLDHFSSLTPRLNLETLRRLGYSSFWVKTYSKGGTLFSDAILGNGYLVTNTKNPREYYRYIGNFQDLEFFEKENPSFGFFVKENRQEMDSKNSFEMQNKMYQSILGENENLFEIHEDWIKNNLTEEKGLYKIVDKKAFNSLEQTLWIGNKQVVYLEILKDINNGANQETFGNFNIYINDQLFREKALEGSDNGVMNLGTYENSELNIKIEFLNDIELNNITLATMENWRYEDFIEKTKTDSDIHIDRNQLTVKITSQEDTLFFLPFFYNEGYQLKVNGKEQEVTKVFDAFIGAQLEKGENEIVFTFTPPKGKIALAISFVSLLLLVVMIRKNWYQKLLDWKLGQKIAAYLYHSLFLLAIGIGYIGLVLVFIISYFHVF